MTHEEADKLVDDIQNRYPSADVGIYRRKEIGDWTGAVFADLVLVYRFESVEEYLRKRARLS